MRLRTLLGGAGALLAGASLAVLWPHAGATRAPAGRVPSLLGSRLPDVRLSTLSGSTVSLDSAREDRPTLIIITKASDAESCTQFAFESRIIARKLPALRILIVGSGPEPGTFRSFFAAERIEHLALLDSTRTLASALHLLSEPAVLLVDREGHVLLFDDRPVGRASQFPIGRVLPALSEGLQPLLP